MALSKTAGSSDRQGHSPAQPQPLLCRLSVRAKGQPAAPAPSLRFLLRLSQGKLIRFTALSLAVS